MPYRQTGCQKPIQDICRAKVNNTGMMHPSNVYMTQYLCMLHKIQHSLEGLAGDKELGVPVSQLALTLKDIGQA